jgi:hypothetical protein
VGDGSSAADVEACCLEAKGCSASKSFETLRRGRASACSSVSVASGIETGRMRVAYSRSTCEREI